MDGFRHCKRIRFGRVSCTTFGNPEVVTFHWPKMIDGWDIDESHIKNAAAES